MKETRESPPGVFARKKTIRVLHRGPREALSYLKFKLFMVDGPLAGREYVIEHEKIRVGSAPDNDLVIDHDTVSRYHFEIQATATGHRIRDLNSTNGIELDGCRVMDAYLHSGAQLSIGELSMMFKPLQERVEIPLSAQTYFGQVLGHSAGMRAMFHLAERVAPHDTTLLLTGETGTGKGLLAESIHEQSPRCEHPLVVVDCATIPNHLMESELFGHVKGSFTGATNSRRGAFMAAQGGTVFLDEIGELPAALQVKLLRVLESRQIKPVGGTAPLEVDVRIIAATNRNLKHEIESRRFRQDLYFRLNGFELSIPPLRERHDDIPRLARAFLKELAPDNQRQFTAEAMHLLQRHDWPGNVRELRNVIERVVHLVDETTIESTSLLSISLSQGSNGNGKGHAKNGTHNLPIHEAKEQFEKDYLINLLHRHGNNVSAAARAAQVHRQSLHRLLRKHQVRSATPPVNN